MAKNEQSLGNRGPASTFGAGLPSAKKLTKWSKEPTVMDLKNDLEAARSSHDSHVVRVKGWRDIRNITGSLKPKKVKNRSQIQPKLVRRQNEWRYSALSEPFLNSHKLFDVEPVTFEDGAAADQNALVLNWQMRTKLNIVNFIDEYVRTAVDEGSVVVRLGWARESTMETIQVPVYEYIQAQPEELQALEQAVMLKQSNPREYLEIDEALQAAVEYFEETGVPTLAQIVDYTEEKEEVVTRNEPTLQIIDPENIWVDPSCEGDVEKAKFVIVSYETTKYELKKDKRFKNLDRVNWSGNRVLAQPDHATNTPNDFQLNDDLRSPIVAYEYWGWYDVNGDENPIPIVATWIGDTLVRLEENPFPDEKPPFVVVPYMPIKKMVFGEPDAEILEDNQKVLGAIMRGMIDLMGRSANSQTGTAKGFLDVTNKRKFEAGADYEFNPGNGDPRISIYQHTYPEIPNSALTMLQLQNQEAEAMSGVKAFSGGLSAETYGEVAAGIKGMLDASAKREMSILRRLAKGMVDIGKKIMGMNAVFMSDEEVIRVTNRQFVTVRREDLKGNFDLRVDISTAEVDEAKAQDLGFMLQTMGPNMDPKMSQKILADIAELKRMPELAMELRNYEPQPDPLAEKAKELELAKMELELMELQAKIAERQAKAQNLEADTNLKTLEFVEQETGTKHQRDLQKQAAQAQSNQDLEVTKALLKPEKPGEGKPKVEAAIGYNTLSEGPLGPR